MYWTPKHSDEPHEDFKRTAIKMIQVTGPGDKKLDPRVVENHSQVVELNFNQETDTMFPAGFWNHYGPMTVLSSYYTLF